MKLGGVPSFTHIRNNMVKNSNCMIQKFVLKGDRPFHSRGSNMAAVHKI